jgi:hypothetical protein
MAMRNVRWCATTAVTAALLLTGCGSGAESNGTTGKAAPLTQEQVRQTLPDGEAMTGWKESARPTSEKMDRLHRSQACPIKGNAGCENSRFFGASTFQRDGKAADVAFQVVAYDSEQAAKDAYDVLWDGFYDSQAGQKARTLELGALGDEHDARLGSLTLDGTPRAVTQIRVGTTLLWTIQNAAHQGDIDEDHVRELATLLAERSQQAQNGEKPSASLDG